MLNSAFCIDISVVLELFENWIKAVINEIFYEAAANRKVFERLVASFGGFMVDQYNAFMVGNVDLSVQLLIHCELQIDFSVQQLHYFLRHVLAVS